MRHDIATTSITTLFEAEMQGRFPRVEILTRRLRLRAYTEADVDQHKEIFAHEVARAWSIAPQPYTRERALDWCRHEAERIRQSGEGVCWAGEDRVTKRLVGMTGLHHTDWQLRTTDVSATAAAEVIGRGYASEALRAISHWALIDRAFNRVQILAHAGNTAPQHVAEACGFVREGVLRRAGSHRGEPADMVVYSLTPADLSRLPEPDYTLQYPGVPNGVEHEPRIASFPVEREMELT